jgi:hypothetical protein
MVKEFLGGCSIIWRRCKAAQEEVFSQIRQRRRDLWVHFVEADFEHGCLRAAKLQNMA